MKIYLLIISLLCNFTYRINAQNWSALYTGESFDGPVLCLLVDEATSTLYAGGAFVKIDGKQAWGVAKWNGVSWEAVGSGFGGPVYALAMHKGELYAGGFIKKSGSTVVNNIARWNGTTWESVGGGTSTNGSYDYVSTIKSFKDELYIGGTFTSAGTTAANNIAKWDGTTWHAIGGGTMGVPNGKVNTMHIHNNELYIGGHFVINALTTKLQYRIAKLGADHKWLNVGTTGLGDATNDWNVTGITTYKGDLYACGRFNVLENGTQYANHIARWNGFVWTPLGTNQVGVASAETDPLRAVITYNNKLYTCGTIDSCGGLFTENIASYDGSNWEPVNPGTNGRIYAMAIYNGNLIMAGYFTSAGGKSLKHNVQYSAGPVGLNDLNKTYSTTLSPNPFRSESVLKVTGKPLKNASLRMIDITGKQVGIIQSINQNHITLKQNNLTGGVYFYVIEQDQQIIANGRFILMQEEE